MNINDIPKWIGIVTIGLGSVASYAVTDYKVDEAVKDIKELQKKDEQQIRIEERQKMMQEDLKEIKQLIKEATK